MALKLTPNAQIVLKKRYLIKDDSGQPTESVEELFWRVALAIAQPDAGYEGPDKVQETARKFYSLMTSLDFMPNSPTLMNAGRQLGQLSACFGPSTGCRKRTFPASPVSQGAAPGAYHRGLPHVQRRPDEGNSRQPVGLQSATGKTVEVTIFDAKKFATDVQYIPRKLAGQEGRDDRPLPRPRQRREAGGLAAVPRPAQYFGVAQADAYFRRPRRLL